MSYINLEFNLPRLRQKT